MIASGVRRTLTAAESWLHSRDAPEAVIDRLEASSAAGPAAGPDPSGPEAATRWIRRLLDTMETTRPGDRDLATTARTLLTVRELREAAGLAGQDPAIGRAIAWIRSRRGIAGAWTDGCSPARHEAGFCHHFVGGFFSPAPPDRSQQGTRLRCGVEAASDGEGRFLASATALRCVLEWQPKPTTDGRLHLRGLRGVVRRWLEEPLPGLSAAALLAAVHALARSRDPDDRRAAEDGIRLVAGRQRGDGSWVGADAFQALDVLLDASAAGVCHERCHTALWHGARLLVSTQKPDGSWGEGDTAARRGLIACRALRQVDPDGS